MERPREWCIKLNPVFQGWVESGQTSLVAERRLISFFQAGQQRAWAVVPPIQGVCGLTQASLRDLMLRKLKQPGICSVPAGLLTFFVTLVWACVTGGNVMSPDDHKERIREKKRQQFAAREAPKKRSRLLAATLGVLIVGGALYFALGRSGEEASDAVAGQLRIPIADVESGRAKFFNHTLENNKPIRFFVIRSADGVYRSALDACDVCFHAKKGYRQQGQDMICNNCGLNFHSTLINEVSGGCNPVGIPTTIEGGYVVVRTSDLEKGNLYF